MLYDPIGNLLSRHVKDKEGRTTSTYTYDDLNQLTTETGQEAHHYQYDSLHNRLVKDEQNYTVNSLNQLSDDSKKTFTYDQNGNRKTSSGTSYHYDALDRLTAIVEGAQRIEYTYDDLNRRLSKQAFEKNGNEWRPISTLQYLYIGQDEVGAYQDERCIELRILGSGKGAEIGAAVAIELGNKTYAPVHDSMGNVTCLIDADTGKVEETYRYTAYGEHLFTPTKNPWLFASKRHDPETNLVYFGRRYYESATGSWLTPDPSGFDDGSNLYAYVHNNPLTHIDLYGLESMASANLDRQRDAHFEFRKKYDAGQSRHTREKVAGAVYGAADFAVSTLHDIQSAAFYIGAYTGDMDINHHETYGAAQAVDHLQSRQMAAVGTAIAGAFSIDPSDLTYQSYRNMTRTGLEIASLVTGGYGATRSVISINKLVRMPSLIARRAKTISPLSFNPLKETRYSKKVLLQMENNLKTGQPDFHGFPKIVDNYANLGQRELIRGKDSFTRVKLTLDGSYRNFDGRFEWIIEADKSINHRLFVPNSKGGF